jgi:hypothetical protein
MMQIYLKIRLSLIQWNFPNLYIENFIQYSSGGSRVAKVETNPERLIIFLSHIQWNY